MEFLARLQLQLGQFKEGRKSGEEALKILIGAVLEDVCVLAEEGGFLEFMRFFLFPLEWGLLSIDVLKLI